ncbi:MAG TPA: ATP-binding cassette domain-containing protein [Fimbriiglobus sp.]
MIEVEGLTKHFSGAATPAADDVVFSVQPGEVFGLLGPNGAGKTTTLRMLCTLLKPTAGAATVAGYDVETRPDMVRQNVGFLSANTGVYDRMTPREMITYYGKLYGLRGPTLTHRLDDLFDMLQMADFADTPGARLSTGQKQKVSIARALVHDPPVLIFDEPTTGLDVLVQRAVLTNIATLRGRGKTVLFSSHIMSEVERLCDRMAVMARGRVVALGSLAELKAQYNENDLEELFLNLVGDPV